MSNQIVCELSNQSLCYNLAIQSECIMCFSYPIRVCVIYQLSYKSMCCISVVQSDCILYINCPIRLYVVFQLSNQIQLREVPMELLQKILKSNRLFVFNEYSVYRALGYWLFMQLNSHLQLMPSHSTVLSFFNRYAPSCVRWVLFVSYQLKVYNLTLSGFLV